MQKPEGIQPQGDTLSGTPQYYLAQMVEPATTNCLKWPYSPWIFVIFFRDDRAIPGRCCGSQALSVEPGNPRALFRRGCAYANALQLRDSWETTGKLAL